MPELSQGFNGPDPNKPKKQLSAGFSNPGLANALPMPQQRAAGSLRLANQALADSDLENYMAGQQSGWEMLGKWAGQVTSEALLGTVEAVSYFGDFQQMWDKLRGDEAEYTNWLADAMKDAKQKIAEGDLKVYQSAEAREGFAPGDATWWASQSPQAIGSTLSLLIPAAGAAGVTAKVAKGLGATANTAKTIGGIGAALTSRYAESTMEASGVYEQVYKAKIAQGVPDAQARAEAGSAASKVWNTNWIFAAQDFLQFNSLLKGFKSMSKGTKGTSWAEVLMQPVSEGAEEAGQFIVSEEARSSAMEGTDYFGDGFARRLYHYRHDPAFKSSVLLGAISGGVFAGAGKLANTISDNAPGIGDLSGKIKKGFQDLVNKGLQRERAAYKGDTGTVMEIDNEMFVKNMFTKFEEGKLNQYKADLEKLSTSSEMEPTARTTIKNQIEDIDFVLDEEGKLKSDPNIDPSAYLPIIQAKLDLRQSVRTTTALTDELRAMREDLVNRKELDPQLAQLKELQVMMEGYRKLASKQPQFAHKVAALQKQFETASAAAMQAGLLQFPDVADSIVTTRDNDLFEKAFQVASSQERLTQLKAETAEILTKEGQKRAAENLKVQKEVEDVVNFLTGSALTVSQIKEKIAEVESEEAKAPLRKRLQEVMEAQKASNQDTLKEIIEPPDDVVEGPEDIGFPPDDLSGPPDDLSGPPDDLAPPPDELMPPDDMEADMALLDQVLPPDDEVGFAGGLSKEQANKWGLTPEQTKDIVSKVDVETRVPKQKTEEQKAKDAEAVKKVKETTTVSAWLKETDANGQKTIYTNLRTGEKLPVDQVFATDKHGNLLANTPALAVGTKVTLRVENDSWVVNDKFRPKNEGEYIINVYVEGESKPIKQLPSVTNPRLTKKEAELNKKLRDLVIKHGVIETTVSAKNIGTIRKSDTLNSLQILESDYIKNADGVWDMGYLPHNPPIGYIDFNGRIVAPNIGSMQGMSKEMEDDIDMAITASAMSRKDLSELKGKALTFRRSPDGSLRFIPLEFRLTTPEEQNWLWENLQTLLIRKQYNTLSQVIHVPVHPTGIYKDTDDKGKPKRPEILDLDRHRFHVVNTTKTTSDLLVPLTSKQGKPIWISIPSGQFGNFFAEAPFEFRIINDKGAKSPIQKKYEGTAEIVAAFKKILNKQFRNVNIENLNTEIQYTDPVTGNKYPAFYDYLVETGVAQTNLPGTKTIGAGADSSYSFKEAAIYLDPNPSRVVVETTPEETEVTITNVEPLPPPPSEEKAKNKSDDDLLGDFFGPKLKASGFKVMSEKELNWFKEIYGEEYLEIAKEVDTFVAANGEIAFGQYYNGLVTLAELSPEGTAYHEAFHLFFDSIQPKRKERILKEASKVFGSKLTDVELEEELATDFERYKLSDGRYKPAVAEAKGFFAKLLNLIKKILGFKAPIERLFRDADIPMSDEQRARIAERKSLQDGEPQFKLLKGFIRAAMQQEAVQGFASEVMRVAHEAARTLDKNILDVLTDKSKLNSFFGAIRGNFENDASRIKAIPREQRSAVEQVRYLSYLGMGLTEPAPGEERFAGSFEDPVNEAGFPMDGFKTKVLKELAKYGFRVSIKDKTNYSVPETDAVDPEVENRELKEEDEGERIYDIDHTQLNPSKSLSNRVRLFLSTIPEPTGAKTVFGTPKYIDFRRVDGNITMKLVNSLNPLTKLQELAENDPISRAVYDALINERNKGNMVLYQEFLAKYTRDGYYKDSVVIQAKEVPVPEEERDGGKFTRTEYEVKTMNSDQNSADKTLLNRWREEAVRVQVIETDGAPIERTAKEISTNFSNFKNKYFENLRKNNRLPYSEVKAKFIEFAKAFGANIPDQVWQELDQDKEKSTTLKDMFFGMRSRSMEDLVANYVKGKDPYEGSNILSELATRSIPYVENPSGGAYLNEKGDQEYPNNTPSYITEFFNRVKQYGKDIVSFYRNDPFYTNNQFLNAILAHPERIELKFTSTLRDNDDTAMAFEERTEIESVIMRLVMFYNNGADDAKIFVGTPSDKTKQPTVTLPKHKGTRARDFLTTVLKWTALQESARINRIKAYEGVREAGGSQITPLPTDIENYNKSTNFLYIPQLNNIEGLSGELTSGEVSVDDFKRMSPQAETMIDKFIDSEYGKFLAFLEENDIITLNGDEIVNERLPEGLVDGSLSDHLKEFFYNDLAWRMEVSKVLQGDFALYKPDKKTGDRSDDYFKRQYQLVTPGYKGYSDTPVTITRGVYAKQIKTLTDAQINELAELVGDKEVAKKYKEVNKTDAQSLMTVAGYRKLASSLGQWTKKHEQLWTIAWSKGITARQGIQDLINAGAISDEEGKQLRGIAANIVLEPFKPFQYNDREIKLPDGKIMIIKEQFKDSITPITPELAMVHDGYRTLLEYMQAPENGIDIMSAADTVKAGLYGVVSDFTKPAEQWQKRKIDLNSFRFPQFIPDTKKEEVSGTQFHKLALGNILDDTQYTINGEKKSGKEVKEIFNKLWEEKVKNSSDELKKRLGVGDNMELSENPRTRRDQLFKLKTVLEQELSSRDINENYMDVLELVRLGTTTDFTLPLSFPAFGSKFQSMLTNLWKKSVLRQKSPGYSAVNLADWGVGFSDELKFLRDEDGKIVEAEIGLPLNFMKDIGLQYGKQILPDGTIMWNSTELTENQRKALQFILYRIPTSNKSSMVPVRVVRVTPPQLNNIVLIPGELTIQQGLDFDVDKSQLIRRTLNEEGKIDDSVDTRLFDVYWGILTNKAHIKELVTPLASPTLEAKVAEYRDLGLIDMGSSSSPFSVVSDVKAEIRNKDGKREIGVASRFNTGHAVLQTIMDYVGVNARINLVINGSKYVFDKLGRMYDALGTLISENHAESQQAALDAAKSPLLSYLNVTTGTMAAFHTMINFGVPLPVITDFFMQPVLREWTKYYKQEGKRVNKATERLFKNNPDVKDQYNSIKQGSAPNVLMAKQLTEKLKTPVGKSAQHDAAVLSEFLRIMKISDQLTKINNVLSIDTFQDTTGIEALEAMQQQKADATNENMPVYVDPRVFDINTTPPTGRRLAAFYKYGIDDALEYIGQFYPSAGPAYRVTRSTFATALGFGGLTNKEVIRKLNQYLDFFQLQGDATLSRALTFNHPLYNPDKSLDKSAYTNRWSYFKPEASLWKYINRMVEKIPALASNELIKSLESRKERVDGVQLIGIRNTDNNTNKTEITNAWWELLNANTPEVRALAHDLIRYSIYTSGFTYGIRSFVDLVPVQFWVQSGIGKIWKGITESNSIDSTAAITNYVRHAYKTIERFPEIYGRWTKKGFQSEAIVPSSLKVVRDTDHITEFQLTPRELDEVPKWYRMKDNEIGTYRLYESDSKNPLHFKEVQPLGEKYLWEVTASREKSLHPRNKDMGSPNPWGIKTFNYEGKIGYELPGKSPRMFFPDGKTVDAKTMLETLLKSETNHDNIQVIKRLLQNADKLFAPVELAGYLPEGVAGRLNIMTNEDGSFQTQWISILDANVFESEADIRSVILHELIHAFSVGFIDDPKTQQEKDFVAALTRLRKDASKRFDHYGLTNNAEFLAELGSHKEFRELLRKNDLWSRILRYFRKLLGMKESYDEVLDNFYKILDGAGYIRGLNKTSSFDVKTEDVSNEKFKKEKKEGKKRLDLYRTMLSQLKARKEKLAARGKKPEAKNLENEMKIMEDLQKTNRNESIVRYLILVDEEMQELKAAYNSMAKDPTKINAEALFSMREQLVSYKLLDSFSDQIRLNPEHFVPKGGNSAVLIKQLDDLRAAVHQMQNDTRRLAILRFAQVIKSTLTDPNLTIDSIVDQLEVADRDIAWLDRWTDVGLEMNDAAVRTAHKILKDNKAKADRMINDDLYVDDHKPEVATIAVKKTAKNGKQYWGTEEVQFQKTSMFKALNDFEAWMGNKNMPLADKFADIIDVVESFATDSTGITLVSPFSPKGERILGIKKGSKDYPLRQFYETFVLGYLKSQESIPLYSMRPGLRIPSIQRSVLEAVLNESGTKKLDAIKEQVIDAVRMRYDETDFKAVDENGKPQEYLPVRFISKQDGKDGRLSTKEVSLDIALTIPMFINEMYTRDTMEKVHADLELGKMVLAEREVMKTKRIKGKGLVPFLSNEREGMVLESGKFETIPGAQSNSHAVFEGLLRRFMYGQVKKAEGAFEVKDQKFSLAKMLDSFLKFTGFKIMFGNLAIPLTNGIVGELTLIKEMVGGNIINRSDYRAGKRLFKEAASAAMADLGSREKKTKYGRIFTYFNPLDTHRPVTSSGVDTNYMRTVFDKISRSGSGFVDYYLSSVTLGAVFNKFKAQKDGKEVSLYDALEVSPNGRIQLGKGYTYKGKKELTDKDINEVRDYTLRTYEIMNGIYNQIDKPAMTEFIIGRLVGFMRNWLIPGINARWKSKFYDERLKQENEGHYVSALLAFNNIFGREGWVKNLTDSLRILTWFGTNDPELLLFPNEMKLDDQKKQDLMNMRKANIRKTLFELYTVTTLSALLAIGWDGDDDDNRMTAYARYMAARIRREMMTFADPSTAWDVLKSPTVALNTIDGIRKVIDSGVNAGWAGITGQEQPVYERGPYKGENKLWADTRRHFGLGFEKQFEDLETKTRLVVKGYR